MTLNEAATLLGNATVKTQRIVAQRDGDIWLVMWPDGTVREFQSHDDAERGIKRRMPKADIAITTIEWTE